MVRITLFGGLILEIDGRPVIGRAAQRKRLALVAILASAPTAMSRDKLVALLWSEADTSTARHQLAAAIYDLRRALGEGAIISGGDDLRFDTTLIACDVRRFDELLEAGDREGATSLYRGPFLDGFHLSDAPEFERWVEAEQSRHARRYGTAVEALARAAAERGDHRQAAELWTRLATSDPLSSRVAIELARALAAAGDRVVAIQQAQRHMALVRAEFGAKPDPQLVALVEELQRNHARWQEIAPVATSTPAAARLTLPASTAHVTDISAHPPPPAPPRRSQARRAAALLLGVSIMGVAGAVVASRKATIAPWRDHRLVVIAPLENRTGDSTLDRVGMMAADWMTHAIPQLGLVEVVDVSTAFQSARTVARDSAMTVGDARLRAIAEAAGAGVVVGGAFYRRGDSLTFQVEVVDAKGGRVLRSIPPLTASVRDPMAGIDQLRERTLGALATLFDERLSAYVAQSSPIPTAAAYLEYVQGLEQSASHEPDAAIAHFQRARALDSTFVLPLITMRFDYANRGDTLKMYALDSLLGRMRDQLSPLDQYAADYMTAFQRADWEACYRAVKNAAAIAPQSGWPSMVAYVAVVRFLRPREAAEALERVDPDYGYPRRGATFWYWRALARHLMGDHQRALAAAREGGERLPFDQEILSQEIAALAGLGDVAGVRAALERLLRLPASPPGPYWWPSRMHYLVNAGLELQAHGQSAAARKVLEESLAWSHAHQPSDSLRAGMDRTTRGIALYCLHRWPEAQATFDTLVATGAVDWESSHWRDPRYWLASLAARRGDRETAEHWASQVELPYARARVAAIFGERERAVALLRSSIADGRDTHVYIDYDCDFESLREYRPFRELLVPPTGAADWLQAAIRTALR